MGMLKYYRLANLLSLDVAVGAICCALFFSHLFDAKLNIAVFVALGLTVWAVYTVDHLRDSFASRKIGADARRRFHRDHSRTVIVALGICLILLIATLFLLPLFTLLAGTILLMPVGVYVLLQKKICWLKELLVSLLYTAGVILPSANRLTTDLETVIIIGTFLLIALINLLIFSWYDHDRDIAGGHYSAVTRIGRRAASTIIWVIFVLATTLIVSLGWSLPAIVLAAMLLLHLGIFLFERFFAWGDRYRIVGEAIFFIPVILVFF